MVAPFYTVRCELVDLPEFLTVFTARDQQDVIDLSWEGQGQYWGEEYEDQPGMEDMAEVVKEEMQATWQLLRTATFTTEPQEFVPDTENNSMGDKLITIQLMTSHQLRQLQQEGVSVEWTPFELGDPADRSSDLRELLTPRS